MRPAAGTGRRALVAFALASLAVLPAASVGAGTLELESRVSAATGRWMFDRVTTDAWWSPGLAWVSGAWTWRAATPIVLRDTPLLTVSGTELVPTGGPVRDSLHDAGRGSGGRRRTIVTSGEVDPRWEWGVTEPVVRADARWHTGGWVRSLGGGVKIPGYSSDGFGTGEWDGWLSLGAGRDVARDIALVATASHAWWGDPPGLTLEDTWSAVVELTRDAGTGANVALFGTFAESAVPGYADAWTAGLSFASRLERGDRVGLSVELGLVDVAPDFRASFTYNLKLAGD